MTFSNFSMSEHSSALFKKFQGNGWALTCSPESRVELSALLSDEISAAEPDCKTAQPKIPYQFDWADIVLERSLYWKADDDNAPLWLIKATEGSDFALFQLPPPDHRWAVKIAGRILEPFDYRMAGWADLHDIMAHGFVLDHSVLVDEKSTLGELQKQRGNRLRNAELLRGTNGEEIDFTFSGSRAKTKGLKSCSDSFHKQIRDRLDRVFKTLEEKDRFAGKLIKGTVHFRNGQWSFSSSFRWMTTLGEIPYDARMVLTGSNWEIEFPDSTETLIVRDSAGMRAIARVLMCNNIPCPCALVADIGLIAQFLSRPRHHKYFDAIYRRPKVLSGDPKNNEVEHAICVTMQLRPGKSYVADHVIPETSELHTVCELPTGSRVTLTQADALEGVRDLLLKQKAKLFFCREPNQPFKRVLSDIEAGIEFARKQEKLLRQIQPRSEECQERVQKAIYRTKKELKRMGDWTTRYDRLGDHLYYYIRTGLVVQYTGPYRWKVEGIDQTPDTLDLAADHIEYKHNRIKQLMRGERAKMKAEKSLKVMGASAS